MRKFRVVLPVILPILLVSCSQSQEEFNASFGYKTEPIVQPCFEPLAPGDIQALGWLYDQAMLARDGFVGHLDEYEPPYPEEYEDPTNPWAEEFSVDANVFAKAWIAEEIGYKAIGSNPEGTNWPLEQSAYWLDGALRLGYLLNDTVLVNKIEKRLDLVVKGVNNGGDIEVSTAPMPEKWDWPLDAPLKLKVPARKFGWKPSRYVSTSQLLKVKMK